MALPKPMKTKAALVVLLLQSLSLQASVQFNLQDLPNCIKYSNVDKSICEVCEKGHYLKSGTCLPCLLNCLDCTSLDVCTQCKIGHYVGNKKDSCPKCEPQCLECTSKSRCTKCAHGYFLSVRTCVTDKVRLLFFIGIIILGISALGIAACALRICFTREGTTNKDMSNLFQIEAE